MSASAAALRGSILPQLPETVQATALSHATILLASPRAADLIGLLRAAAAASAAPMPPPPPPTRTPPASPQTPSSPYTSPQTQAARSPRTPKPNHCDVCRKGFGSAATLAQHLGSAKHKQRVQKLGGGKGKGKGAKGSPAGRSPSQSLLERAARMARDGQPKRACRAYYEASAGLLREQRFSAAATAALGVLEVAEMEAAGGGDGGGGGDSSGLEVWRSLPQLVTLGGAAVGPEAVLSLDGMVFAAWLTLARGLCYGRGQGRVGQSGGAEVAACYQGALAMVLRPWSAVEALSEHISQAASGGGAVQTAAAEVSSWADCARAAAAIVADLGASLGALDDCPSNANARQGQGGRVASVDARRLLYVVLLEAGGINGSPLAPACCMLAQQLALAPARDEGSNDLEAAGGARALARSLASKGGHACAVELYIASSEAWDTAEAAAPNGAAAAGERRLQVLAAGQCLPLREEAEADLSCALALALLRDDGVRAACVAELLDHRTLASTTGGVASFLAALQSARFSADGEWLEEQWQFGDHRSLLRELELSSSVK